MKILNYSLGKGAIQVERIFKGGFDIIKLIIDRK